MPYAIKIENLGKSYRIDHEGQRGGYRMMRESLMNVPSAIMRRMRNGRRRGQSEEFWALRDIDLVIEPGEILGIIGQNGAGKSTLLKILSRITKPTVGQVELHGRVSSLLEVGTGFHPELTGRENIFLNGSILGMSLREIARRFDEIVDFSGVERFLDTPVKRYSSGMYLRLAFAVAAHLEPEILLLDEVLAVGDAQFQKKCLGKMEGIATGGRTIILVSHQMSVIQRLSRRVALLESGRLAAFGARDEVIAQYLASSPAVSAPEDWIDLSQASRRGDGRARFIAARYRCPDGIVAGHPYPDGPLEVRLVIESGSALWVDKLGLWVSDQNGTPLVGANIFFLGKMIELQEGRNEVSFVIEQLHLNPGTYSIGFYMTNNTYGDVVDHVFPAVQMDVLEAATEERLAVHSRGIGLVTCHFQFHRH